MKNNLLEETINRACVALRRIPQTEIQSLSIIDCAITLDTLPAIAPLIDIRAQLAERLREHLGPAQISEGNLLEVFLALTALWKYDPTWVSGDQLAYSIQRLVQSEVRVGGPYYSNGHVDTIANLQIASFVYLIAKPLPALNAFLDEIITKGHFEETGLDSPYALYLLATLYNHPVIVDYIESRRRQTTAYQAVVLATIKSPSVTPWKKLLTICANQQPAGFWCQEVLLCGNPGSYISTTAFIVKVLTMYQNGLLKKNASHLEERHKLVTQATRQLFGTPLTPLQQSTLATIDKICGAKKAFEITLLPYFFALALKQPTSLTDHHFVTLGTANVCGWIAYSIYDDFLDMEGIPAQLPIANITMRASLDCFWTAFPENYGFHYYVTTIFNEIDEANAWEVENCRFTIHNDKVTIGQLPKYSKRAVLAARSFAHALGPIAILIHGTKSTPQQTRRIESAFRHYLIARQLSDDLHDWADDMHTGQASYVVSAILRDMRVSPGTYSLSALMSGMQKKFRRTTMSHVCELALRHIYIARQSFIKSGLLKNTNDIYVLIDELELSLSYSLDQHTKARALTATRVSYSS